MIDCCKFWDSWRDPKIKDFDVLVLICDHNIIRFDVSMNDSFIFEDTKGSYKLLNPFSCQFPWWFFVCNKSIHIAPMNELCYKDHWLLMDLVIEGLNKAVWFQLFDILKVSLDLCYPFFWQNGKDFECYGEFILSLLFCFEDRALSTLSYELKAFIFWEQVSENFELCHRGSWKLVLQTIGSKSYFSNV